MDIVKKARQVGVTLFLTTLALAALSVLADRKDKEEGADSDDFE
jgi:hypothetical protein